jgi:hypothetical protein
MTTSDGELPFDALRKYHPVDGQLLTLLSLLAEVFDLLEQVTTNALVYRFYQTLDADCVGTETRAGESP